MVNKNYEGDADGSITLHRGDLVEVLKTSANGNSNGNGYKSVQGLVTDWQSDYEQYLLQATQNGLWLGRHKHGLVAEQRRSKAPVVDQTEEEPLEQSPEEHQSAEAATTARWKVRKLLLFSTPTTALHYTPSVCSDILTAGNN